MKRAILRIGRAVSHTLCTHLCSAIAAFVLFIEIFSA